jgi:hypothetical protein
MKTTHPASVGADPIRSFLAALPRRATVLNCCGYYCHGKKSIAIVYAENGIVHRAECTCEAGLHTGEGGES